ncbi:transcription termination/antitermination protein NusG [Fulvitalea axinellae]|uniref:Transcription termination/antitermination protein NusG n=1 Tax=Fulvitalea axinellae TaxID=1182444 RepID=A0AAU9DCR8_9BACT|nr:transcription termination/antitermination protein NusG [Fulvitalea axinellae]
MTDLKWYVIRVVSGKEKKLKAYLETEVARQELEDQVAQVLIPSEKVYEMRNGKKRVRERNYFPGYVLISANIGGNPELIPFIKDMPDVIGFLSDTGSSSGAPVALRESEVNRILGKVEEVEEYQEQGVSPFIVGENVTVMDGPFTGFTGIVEEVFEERKKLNVTVKIFGRNTPVELNYMQVEKQE